jgi:hypothetical protein
LENQKLKMRTVTAVLLLPLAFMIMGTMFIPAHAATPTVVTGQATAADQKETVLSTSGNIIVALITSQLTFTGGIQGTGPATALAVINTSTGQLTFVEQTTVTGTVSGSQPGTAKILIIGNGILGGASQASDVLSQGTGGLAGIHGEGNQATAAGSATTTFSLLVSFGAIR